MNWLFDYLIAFAFEFILCIQCMESVYPIDDGQTNILYNSADRKEIHCAPYTITKLQVNIDMLSLRLGFSSLRRFLISFCTLLKILVFGCAQRNNKWTHKLQAKKKNKMGNIRNCLCTNDRVNEVEKKRASETECVRTKIIINMRNHIQCLLLFGLKSKFFNVDINASLWHLLSILQDFSLLATK